MHISSVVTALLSIVPSHALVAGDQLPVSCISRNIDTGEHKFDENRKL
jgi:hypothetical protein